MISHTTPRAGRTLPLAPLCSAVGAALALGTARVRSEVRALEALGRAPGESARLAALAAAAPSVAVGLALALVGSVGVDGFYPRAPRGEIFVREAGAFTSPTLGIRVRDDGDASLLETASAEESARAAATAAADEGLPSGARGVAAATTAIAGLALALFASRAVLRSGPSNGKARRRGRIRAAALVIGCSLLTLVAFQAAAAHVSPAARYRSIA